MRWYAENCMRCSGLRTQNDCLRGLCRSCYSLEPTANNEQKFTVVCYCDH